MASAAAAASQSSAAKTATDDGPVLSLINKRLRALRKKLNRIIEMERSVSQGRSLNRDQDETLRSKPSVAAAIDELERLRLPISAAVDREIENKRSGETLTDVSDLIGLIYFSRVFDLDTLVRARENLVRRAHERSCCITYDYVTDGGEVLKEGDLDSIAAMGGLVRSRPWRSGVSHREALEECVERAKLWLANSEREIVPDSSVTYAGLKEKLNKIMASDYFTTTPEMRVPVEVATPVGNYTTFQAPGHVSSVVPQVGCSVPLEGSAKELEQEEEELPNSTDNEIHDDETGPVG